MYSFHLFVVTVNGDEVVAMAGNPPITFPTDKRVERRVWTREEFKKYLSYGNIPGTWAMCCARGTDVENWEEEFAASRAELATEVLTK